jgi:hypothetical protein
MAFVFYTVELHADEATRSKNSEVPDNLFVKKLFNGELNI